MADEVHHALGDPGSETLLLQPMIEDRGEPFDYRFRLYICGATEKSQRAVANARRLCDEHLQGRYTLVIVDLYCQPELAQSMGVFAIPTLVLEFPRPVRRFIGDLSDNERLMAHLLPQNGREP